MLAGGELKPPDVLRAPLYMVLSEFEPIGNVIYSFGALLAIMFTRSPVSDVSTGQPVINLLCASESVWLALSNSDLTLGNASNLPYAYN